GPVELLRLEALQALLRRLGHALDLRRDADVTRIGLAAAADGAADGDHRERAEADAVGAEAEHLHHVERALHPAIAPDLDVVAQAAAHERAVRFDDPDLHRQAGATESVLARGSGPAVVAGDGDDVGPRLRDPGGDDADVRHGRDLDRDLRLGIDDLELADDLREVLDRVDVVIVRRRDEVDARLRVARERDFDRDLARRQMAALA